MAGHPISWAVLANERLNPALSSERLRLRESKRRSRRSFAHGDESRSNPSCYYVSGRSTILPHLEAQGSQIGNSDHSDELVKKKWRRGTWLKSALPYSFGRMLS